MPEPPKPEVVANQQFAESLQIRAAPTEPSLGLYQPCYPLSEADFLRLQQSNSLLSGAGDAAVSYGLSDGLPTLGKLLRGELVLGNTPKAQILIPSAAFVVGLGLLAWSIFMAGGRRNVMKRMRRHFSSNPGVLQVRSGEPT